MSLCCFFASIFIRRLVLLAWVLTILWLSLDPAPPVPEQNILGWDKLLHAFAYGNLTLLGGWALSESSPLSKAKWSTVACAAIALGGFVELLQKTFTETRMAEFGDFLANAFGAGIVLLGVFGFRNYKRRQSNIS